MHQAILSSIHTPLTGISTPHLHGGTSTVLSQLLPSSLLEGLLPLLVSGGNFLALRSLSPLQKGSFFLQHLISKPLEVLQCPLLLLLLHNPLLLGFFLDLFLCFSPGLLSHILYTTGLHCLLQIKKELLFFLMLSLYFIVLLLEHFSIVLRNVGKSRGRHNDIETRAKNFFSFIYC